MTILRALVLVRLAPAQAEVGEQGAIEVGLGVGRRQQLLAGEDGVGAGEEGERLRLARDGQPPCAEADHRSRQYDAGNGDRANPLEGIERRLAFERRAVYGDE